MTTKHTPGPWFVADDKVTVFYLQSHHRNPAICTCTADVAPVFTAPRAEQEANARLIAAAPELLAALQEARLLLHRYAIPRSDNIDAIITKAEGKPKAK